MTLNTTWDLDPIFSGGSQSPELHAYLAKISTDLANLETAGFPARLTGQNMPLWVEKTQQLYEVGARLTQASYFVSFLISQNVKDDKALQLDGQADQLGAQLANLWTAFAARCAQQEDSAWEKLITTTDLKRVAFHLNEQRYLARQKMDPSLEALVTELATNGYHAWNRLYGVVSGDKEVQFQNRPLSLGQLQSRFMDDSARANRQAAFDLFEESWSQLSKACALALNHQAGFRLTLYKHRQWSSVLKEPLLKNRLAAATLETMWQVVDNKSAKLLDYFAAKARLFGVDKLSWFDLAAPVGEVNKSFSYETAADFVVTNLRQFNPDIANFSRRAIDSRWVEAEDRPGKRAGAYCATVPVLGQPRIFMTYNGSYNGMLTLAHELGHGYHGWVMRDLPYGARRYSMSVAETASTFNELIVSNAALQAVESDQERLSILGAKLNDAASFLMDIRARFDFELAFFAQRPHQQLSVEELCELMVTAQRRAFKEGLARYHPYFWASKLHFYITDTPFYNFPYTFGYLFSNGLYAQARLEGKAFRERYIALLRDTGSMTTEDLAKTHLGLDLTQPDFWETAVDRVLDDVDSFCSLVDRLYPPQKS
jgi:pepF/M3 family oligoendopeptidase